MTRLAVRRWTVGTIAIVVSVVVFLVPFAFILVTAAKTAPEASMLAFSWPTEWKLWDNVAAVLADRNGILVRAFLNSIVLTVASVVIMVVLAAMVGYVLQRKKSRWNAVINFFVLAGLIVPPAVVPTIWVLQGLGLFKTLGGLILIEATFGLSFCILLFRAFLSTIPRELDEAALIDGAGPIRLFFQVVLPLLKPVIVTVIVVQSVAVFNDFANPLYFLPGDANATVQLTLYAYASSSTSAGQLNLLFADILLITIPPLVMYIFFNRQIVAGMTSGAIKG
ncbi:raffinose/stachyose/melibiose transport system permease protein [Microbacterium sp. ru370.1]|uniref:carbohydrate ABC transporter permease n=1 Tax=unclassified Microbacterium TaxID=2609290 RepID=UPI000888BD25|nr:MULTISPECIES: carbohydrate ABC transporter permease [unclassified Microbacterium]SDO31990.1 raffinose/stachyose/melibiose transport system permease protein [Microbacterium sp. ru370.1]SIT76607.1 raffinose/stachyose/melibiose transport system permease protein [Microbacterium sp. RU1D]